MSIRPVDIQLAMPKAMEVSRTAGNENLRPFGEQTQFAQQLQKQVQSEQTSVVQTQHGDESQNVNKDGRGNAGTYQRRKKRENANGKQEDEQQGKIRRGLLDISL